MSSLRFIQMSDLHLGGRVCPRRFKLSSSDERVQVRQKELRASLEIFAKLAISEKAEVVLIPGDLFDSESVSEDVVNLAIETFAALAPLPVFIAPGNHDPATSSGPYAQDSRKRRGQPLWPENVHLFTSPDFVTVPLNDNITITAHAFEANIPVSQRRLTSPIARPDAEISVLLLHGSRIGGAPEGSAKYTMPFNEQELLSQNFSYTALGHYHSYEEICDSKNIVRAVYGGRPFNAEMPVDGKFAGAAVTGTITPEGVTDICSHSLDTRKIVRIDVACENVSTNESLAKNIAEGFKNSGASENDIPYFVLLGTHAPGLSLKAENLPGYFSGIDISKLRPAYDIEEMLQAADTENAPVESIFAKKIHAMLETADESESQVLRDALYYGLDALRGISPEARNAD